MEALLHVDRPILVGYVLWFGLSLAALLEVVGIRTQTYPNPTQAICCLFIGPIGAALPFNYFLGH